jgi:OOP family OmpA-OmpF porin
MRISSWLQGLLVTLILLALSVPVFAGAPTQDIKGSRDNPLVKRYEGSYIVEYTFNKYDSYTLPLGPTKSKDGKYKFVESRELEGAITNILYLAPEDRSSLEVLRNYQESLEGDGFKPLYYCKAADCGPYDTVARIHYNNKPPLNSDTNAASQLLYAAQLNRPEGDVYAVVYVIENKFWGSEAKSVKGRVYVRLDVIETKPMERKMVTVKAEEMAGEISKQGKIALYGIYFDTDKAEVKPESKPTLDEIAKLLKADPDLKILVVGHTDNQGDLAYNMDLSKRRAQAVVRALTGQYGIEAARLTPAGVGFLAPAATNRTEDGRALNRRVELVER